MPATAKPIKTKTIPLNVQPSLAHDYFRYARLCNKSIVPVNTFLRFTGIMPPPNFEHIQVSEFCVRILRPLYSIRASVRSAVLPILCLRAPRDIFGSVIDFISVQMSRYMARWTISPKSGGDQPVDPETLIVQRHAHVARAGRMLLKYLCIPPFFEAAFSSPHKSRNRANPPHIRNLVSGEIFDRTPVFTEYSERHALLLKGKGCLEPHGVDAPGGSLFIAEWGLCGKDY